MTLKTAKDDMVILFARALWQASLAKEANKEDRKSDWTVNRADYMKRSRKILRILEKNKVVLTGSE